MYSLSPKPPIAGTNRAPTWVRLWASFQKGERLYDHRRRIVKQPVYLIRKLCHLSSHSPTYPHRMELWYMWVYCTLVAHWSKDKLVWKLELSKSWICEVSVCLFLFLVIKFDIEFSSDLADNTSFEPTAIICPLGDRTILSDHGKTFWPDFKLIVPLFATLSPNRALLCTLSSSLLFSKTAIYSLPKRIEPDVPSSCKGPFIILGTDWQTSGHTSVSLCKAILGRTSTVDLMHIICSSNVSQTDLVEALYQALELLENYKSESVSSWDIMGLAIEAYRHVMPPSLYDVLLTL